MIDRVTNFSSESAARLALYGIRGASENFARQCLMARRFAEAGVRCIAVTHGGWDQQNNLSQALGRNCADTGQPIAALLTDLKQRDLLKDTLVIWGGECGRTPESPNADGAAPTSRAARCGWPAAVRKAASRSAPRMASGPRP